jgi:hypothetical protein
LVVFIVDHLWLVDHGQVLVPSRHRVDHVVLVVGLDDTDLESCALVAGPMTMEKSGCSGLVIAAIALLTA